MHITKNIRLYNYILQQGSAFNHLFKHYIAYYYSLNAKIA